MSQKLFLPINKIEPTPREDIIEINYFIENWENGHDFCFISDKHYEMCQSEFSVFTATVAVKAKYKFPSKDPLPNLIEDTRTDSQKVSDILRIWSQILTPTEEVIWNEIAERDISNTISLPSGMRIPKTFIEKDIKAFRDLKARKNLCCLKVLYKCQRHPLNLLI